MGPMSPQSKRCSWSEIAGSLYALDRRLPFGKWWNDLARFRGSSRAFTRWLTHFAAPQAARLVVRSWRIQPTTILDSRIPFLLCLTQETLREGLPLLVAEWMEFRRKAPDVKLNLVLRARPASSEQETFAFVTPFWEQIQSLKRQFGIRHSGVYLWMRETDDAGDEKLLEAARGLVIVARGQGFVDPLALAIRKGKPVITPREDDLPADYPYAFATRPAVLRFIGEPRRLDTSSLAWPIPKDKELANAIGRFAKADDTTLAAASHQLREQKDLSTPLSPVLRGEGLGVRGSLKASVPLTPDPSPLSTGERGVKLTSDPSTTDTREKRENQFASATFRKMSATPS